MQAGLERWRRADAHCSLSGPSYPSPLPHPPLLLHPSPMLTCPSEIGPCAPAHGLSEGCAARRDARPSLSATDTQLWLGSRLFSIVVIYTYSSANKICTNSAIFNMRDFFPKHHVYQFWKINCCMIIINKCRR